MNHQQLHRTMRAHTVADASRAASAPIAAAGKVRDTLAPPLRLTARRRGGSLGDDGHRCAMWDAAYVLGSLSANDRAEFEAHLDGCASCREGVAELSDMPALLSLLDRHEVIAIN